MNICIERGADWYGQGKNHKFFERCGLSTCFAAVYDYGQPYSHCSWLAPHLTCIQHIPPSAHNHLLAGSAWQFLRSWLWRCRSSACMASMYAETMAFPTNGAYDLKYGVQHRSHTHTFSKRTRVGALLSKIWRIAQAVGRPPTCMRFQGRDTQGTGDQKCYIRCAALPPISCSAMSTPHLTQCYV